MSVPYLRLYIKHIKTFSSIFNRLFPYKIACAQQKSVCVPAQSDHSLSYCMHKTMVNSRPVRGEDSRDCTGVHAELCLRSADSRFFRVFMRRLILYLNCRGRQISQNTRKGQNNYKTYTKMSESVFLFSTNKHSATAQKQFIASL